VHSDCIVIQGSNMAEAHPVGFGWVMEAKRRGATVIHVDPRFTRTSAVADLHVPIRAGTDIAFLGGLIHHVLETGAYFEEYVRAYTNAPMLVRDDFVDTEDLAGVFSGYDQETGTYDVSSWEYRGMHVEAATGPRDDRITADDDPEDRPGVHEHERGQIAAPRSPPTRSATTPCSTRGACSRCCAGTTRATPPSWCTRSAASRRSCSGRSPRH
jgi:formate dehydrogenase major subunit